MTRRDCPKCKGTNIVKEPDGSIHTCWDCLNSGEYDQHSSKPKDSGIQI